MMQEKKQEILERLKEFPSSFKLGQRNDFQRIKKVKKTTSQEHGENTTPFQKNADKNLLSFLEYRIPGPESRKKALEHNKEVRDSEPNNVIALANYARMLIDDDDLPEAEKTLKTLDALTESEKLMENARAELAYSYSKFGSREDLKEAIKLYEDIVFYNPERWEWMYRYGVVIQRCLNPEAFVNAEDFVACKLFTEGINAFVEVIKFSKADNATVALAYTKITSMCFSYDRLPEEYKDVKYKKEVEKCRKKTLKDLDVKELSSDECMQKALQRLGDCQNFEFFQEFGRFCRRNKDFKNARIHLEKSRHIQPTTTNCFQLGLLEVDEYNLEKNYVTQGRARNPSGGQNGSYFMKTVFKTASRNMKLEDDVENDHLNKALKYFEEANKLCEYTSAAVLHSQGLVYRRLKRADKAIECFQEARRSAGSQTMNVIQAYEQQGYCFEWLAKQDKEKCDILNQKAITMLFFALEEATHLKLPFSYRGQSAFWLQSLLEDTLNENPERVDAHKNLVKYHGLLGEHTQALQYMKRVLELEPSDSSAHLEMAELLLDGGQCQEALNLLTMMMAPNSEHRSRVLEKKNLLVDARKQLAKENLKTGEIYIASEHFRRAYGIVFDTEDTDMDEGIQIFITGQESENCFLYFSEIIEKYFGLSCLRSNDISPSSRSFLFVFSNAEELRDETKHLVECTLTCIQKKPSNTLCSLTVAQSADLVQSLKSVQFNSVPPYSSWKDVPKDSEKFVELVMKLFEGLTTPVNQH